MEESPPVLDSAWRSEGVDHVCAAFRYQGRAAQAVKRLKFDRVTSLAAPIAKEMLLAVRRLGIEPPDLGDAIVPVPIHWTRRCERGFNQAELIARPLAPELFRPRLLRRVRRTRPQVGLTREERRLNLVGAFRALGPAPARVLLVDDVLTSGGTAIECAKALRAAGAREVSALLFASGG
jgi:ComF family protein